MAAEAVASADAAEHVLQSRRFDLVILDVMMPGEDGTSFCRRLRSHSSIPILMLSALGDDIDRIVGLEIGADDYLSKPFNPRELVARIKSLLRRAPPMLPGESREEDLCYAFGDFRLYPSRRQLERMGQIIELTSGEFALLLLLVERAPRVQSRDQIMTLLKGSAVGPFERSIDTQVSRIRRKLGQDPRIPSLIKTVRSLGYVFAGKVEEIRD